MIVNNIDYTRHTPVNFSGNKYRHIVKTLSKCDFYSDTETKEFKDLRAIYNNLWEKLGLPQNLKPRLQYKAMYSEMSFSLNEYKIKVNKRISPFKMNVRNKTGKNKSLLRHEIEHVKQFIDIVRLLGARKAAREFNKNVRGLNCSNNPTLYQKMQEIEQTMGKISSNSPEGQRAKQYLEALKIYPDLNTYYGIFSIKMLKTAFQYHTNILEKKARNAEKEYKPNMLDTIKFSIKEFFNLIFSKNF